jgi:hypothetical protein
MQGCVVNDFILVCGLVKYSGFGKAKLALIFKQRPILALCDIKK